MIAELHALASAPNPDTRIRILVADAVAMSCQLLAEALQRNKRYEAFVATSASDVMPLLNRHRYDVVLVSTSLLSDPMDVFRLVREIKGTHPEISTVMLLDAPQREWIVEAFRAGALGVFCRADSFQALCKCIHCVHEGQVWANSAELQFVLEALLQPLPVETGGLPDSRPLSKREAEIAHLVADGLSNRQISERLDLSEHTVKNYLFRIFEKLGVATRVELALYFLKRGRGRVEKILAATSATGTEPGKARRRASR